MAFGDTTQSAQGSGTSGAATATLASGATAGNLLIFAVGRSTSHSVGGTWGTPTGFSDLPNSGILNGNMGGGYWYKIAAGGETTVTSNGTGEAGNWCAAVVELEGPFDGTPLDKTAEDESNLAATDTSQTSGTTATTAQNDELGVAIYAADNASNVTDGRAYTNSFSEVIFANSGSRASVIVAKKVLSAADAIESTFSTTDTGDEMYGSVATFKKLVAAGGSVVPVLMAEYRQRRN